MQRLLLLGGLCGLLVLCASACGADGGAGDGDPSQDVEAGDAAGSDATADPAGADVATGSWTTPTLELGTNEQSKATPKDFVPVADEAVLDVVKGPQNLWMVVLAFRTCGLYTQPLVLRARIETDDNSASGKVDVAKQKLNPAPDGLQYYYNFWLVVQNPELSDGKMATITLKIEDADGKVGEHTLRVKLRLK